MFKKILTTVLVATISLAAFGSYNPPSPTTVNGVAKYSDTHGNQANTTVTLSSANVLSTVSGDLEIDGTHNLILNPGNGRIQINAFSDMEFSYGDATQYHSISAVLGGLQFQPVGAATHTTLMAEPGGFAGIYLDANDNTQDFTFDNQGSSHFWNFLQKVKASGGIYSDVINSISSQGISFTDAVYSSPITYSTGTIGQSGLTITGAGGATFSAAMVGGWLIPATGTPALITSYNSTTGAIRTGVSQTIASGTTYVIEYGGVQFDKSGQLGAQSLLLQGNATIGSILSTFNNNLVFNPSTGLSIFDTYFVDPANLATVTVTQSANTVTATSGTPFTNTMVGNGIIQVPGFGSELITGFTDSTHVTVDVSQTIGSGTLSTLYSGGIAGSPVGNFGVGGTLYANTFKFVPSSSVSAKSILQVDANKNVFATALTNGQLWIGNIGNSPTAATLTSGATGNISITNGGGSITIDTVTNPTFSTSVVSPVFKNIVNNSPVTISTVGTTSGADVILAPGTGGNVQLNGAVTNISGTGIAFQSSNPVISSVSNNPITLTPNGSGIINLNAVTTTQSTLNVTGDINLINSHIITNATGLDSYQFLYTTGTISQTTTAVVGSGTTFSSAMVGGLLVPATGTQCIVTGFTDATHITSSCSQTIASSTAFSLGYGGTQFDNGGNLSASTKLFTPSISTSGNSIAFNSKNLTGVGTIGSAAITSTANVQGTTLVGTLGMYTSQSVANTGTITQSGQAVIGSSTAFASTMVGGVLSAGLGGQDCLVIAFTDSTHITLSCSQTVTAGTTYTLNYAGNQFDKFGNHGSSNIYFSNATTGYVPGALNYYEPTTNVTVPFTGAWTGNATFRFSRIGNKVNVMITSAINTAGSASVLNATTGSIPARFIPSEQLRIPFYVRDNGTDKAGLITFNTDGSVEVSAGPAQDTVFSGTGSSGWFSQPIGWNL